MKRKILIFILSLIVAITTAFAMQSIAFAANEATISATDVSAESGELVNVDIVISNNPGIIALRLFAEYDTSKLQLQSVTDGNVFTKGLSTFNDDLSVSKYTMLWIDGASSTNYSGNGTLATLTFKVVEDTAGESIPVKITYDADSTFNSNLDNVSFSVKNGSVKVNAKTYKVKWNVDGTVTEQNLTVGSFITKPANPTKSGYVFAGWTPAVPDKMPAYDLTFTAVFNKIYTCHYCNKEFTNETDYSKHIADEEKSSVTATINIKNNPGSKTINYGDILRLTANVVDKPADAKIWWYVDNVKKAESETFDVSISSGSVEVSVKLIDVNGNAIKDKSGNEISDIETVSVKSGLWQKIVSFFKNLFGVNRVIEQ